MKKLFISPALLLMFLSVPLTHAEVAVNSMFTDNMVLQRNATVPVWGTADDGEKVTVEIQNQKRSATAKDGKWQINLRNLRAGGPFDMTIQGENKITLKNILVGEVWVCSGQSNMEWHVAWSGNPEAEIANANYPDIRFIKVPKSSTSQPLNAVDASWEVCSPDTIADKSAVGYYFGRTLYQQLDIPIGLIMTAWGGTPAESWTSEPTLRAHDDLRSLVTRQEQEVQKYKEEVMEFHKEYEAWMQRAQRMENQGKNLPYPPQMPGDGRLRGWRTSGLYNGMIAPIIPYRIKGAIWYQGESNASRAYQYRKLFSTMIKDWRQNWNQGDFPFYWVQLANFIPRDNAKNAWPELREAQNMALDLPNTGTAITIDIGNPTDIHPKNKQEVGRRLALNAMAKDYGFDIEYQGPMYESHRVEGNKIRVYFDHADSGLVFLNAAKLNGFTIAGKDQNFHPAEAIIEGDSVVVKSEKVTSPVAVRYAWKDNPEDANLYNNYSLPASPFRTDEWPGVTEGNE